MIIPNLSQFAEFISTNDPQSVRKALRLLRFETNQDDAFQDKKQMLQSADHFFQWKLVEPESEEAATYELLARWAGSDKCCLDNKQNVEEKCWKIFIDEQLQFEKYPAEILSLIKDDLFNVPNKLIVLLMWLTERDVTPDQIIDSNMLSRFYLYHFVHRTEEGCAFQYFYQRLDQLSDIPALKELRAQTATTKYLAANIMCFDTNATLAIDGSKLESEPKKVLTAQQTTTVKCTKEVSNLLGLVNVFGIECLKLLELNDEIAGDFFDAHFIKNTLSKINKLLEILLNDDTLPEINAHLKNGLEQFFVKNPPIFFQALEKHPILIVAFLTNQAFIESAAFTEIFRNAILSITRQQYKFAPSVSYLFGLSELYKKAAAIESLQKTESLEALRQHNYKLLLKFGFSYDQIDVHNSLIVLTDYKTLCYQTLQSDKSTLIENVNANMSYFELESEWLNYEQRIRYFLKHCDVVDDTQPKFPLNTNHLKVFILQQRYKNTTPNDFKVDQCLLTIIDDKLMADSEKADLIERLKLEAVLFIDPRNVTLLNAIVATLPDNWHEKKVGNSTLSTMAISQQNEHLLALIHWPEVPDLLQKLRALTDEQLSVPLKYIFSASPELIDKNTLLRWMLTKSSAIFESCARLFTKEKIPLDFLKKLISSAYYTPTQLDKLQFLLNPENNLAPSRDEMKAVLMSTAGSDYQLYPPLNFLICLKSPFQFSAEEISEALLMKEKSCRSRWHEFQSERRGLADFLRNLNENVVITLPALKALINGMKGSLRTEPRVLLMVYTFITLQDAWNDAAVRDFWKTILGVNQDLYAHLKQFPYPEDTTSGTRLFAQPPLQRVLKDLERLLKSSTVDTLNNKEWDDFFPKDAVGVFAESRLEPQQKPFHSPLYF